MTDSVILLHGILRSARSMRGLQRYLQQHGYRVLNLDYPSRRHDLRALADIIHPPIEQFMQGSDGAIHFVGHSMGGLVIRYYLQAHPISRLGRIVMLGTPNRGSEVADFLRRRALYRWGYGPAGQQLCTDAAHAALPPCEIGVIAGNRSLDPLSSWLIGGINDGKVSLASARPPEKHADILLPATHSFMPSNPQVQRQVLNFVKEGRFTSPA